MKRLAQNKLKIDDFSNQISILELLAYAYVLDSCFKIDRWVSIFNCVINGRQMSSGDNYSLFEALIFFFNSLRQNLANNRYKFSVLTVNI